LVQARVSKHPAILRKAGLVGAHKAGRNGVNRLNGEGLKPIYDGTKSFEHFWEHQLDRIKKRAEEQTKSKGSVPDNTE
jgi:hypothetical protein